MWWWWWMIQDANFKRGAGTFFLVCFVSLCGHGKQVMMNREPLRLVERKAASTVMQWVEGRQRWRGGNKVGE